MSRIRDLSARIASREAHVGVIGLGYVGLPLAVQFARVGFRVTGFDLDASKVEALCAGGSYIEDVPAEDVAEVTAAGRLEASTDFAALSACDVIHVCVPTPLTKARDPDVSHIAASLESIQRRLRSG
ncbi:MAG: NAD(P)-binding domain-containing protein, partial [Myxococcota bacterium]